MDLHELRVAARLIDGLAKRALFAEKQMVASEGQCAEWQRIAGALKAERDAERMVHDEYKERNRELFNRNQRLTAELAVIKDERDALRSTTIDTAAGRLLDAFGSLANEPRNGATDDEYRDRIVRKIHSIKMERDALRAECDDLRRVFALVHGSLGIQQGEHIGNAIEALKKERDCAKAEWARHEARCKELSAELIALKFPKPARNHPVAVGEYVQRLTGFNTTPAGEIGRVTQVDDDASEIEYEVTRPNGQRGVWCAKNCTPCEPPTAATHDTPEGKASAESAVKREPKPGDVVRLSNTPPEVVKGGDK